MTRKVNVIQILEPIDQKTTLSAGTYYPGSIVFPEYWISSELPKYANVNIEKTAKIRETMTSLLVATKKLAVASITAIATLKLVQFAQRTQLKMTTKSPVITATKT